MPLNDLAETGASARGQVFCGRPRGAQNAVRAALHGSAIRRLAVNREHGAAYRPQIGGQLAAVIVPSPRRAGDEANQSRPIEARDSVRADVHSVRFADWLSIEQHGDGCTSRRPRLHDRFTSRTVNEISPCHF